MHLTLFGSFPFIFLLHQIPTDRELGYRTELTGKLSVHLFSLYDFSYGILIVCQDSFWNNPKAISFLWEWQKVFEHLYCWLEFYFLFLVLRAFNSSTLVDMVRQRELGSFTNYFMVRYFIEIFGKWIKNVFAVSKISVYIALNNLTFLRVEPWTCLATVSLMLRKWLLIDLQA